MTGEDIVTTRRDNRSARLSALEEAPVPRRLGTAKGEFVVPDDFNDPLSASVLYEFDK